MLNIVVKPSFEHRTAIRVVAS